ncbi:MAG: hypothetical protein OXH86_19035 [Acidimicrobiaceae bacterium]|nr:hypothetical protein [Acidimicrobiaceae bacterium]MDE0318892.1 hypothetical protein [Acidimicrobiaceae bacterium]MDE0499440.1 hypothetical protein [Acidimicrobiaceae bacterium]
MAGNSPASCPDTESLLVDTEQRCIELDARCRAVDHDEFDALFRITAGAGGVESQASVWVLWPIGICRGDEPPTDGHREYAARRAAKSIPQRRIESPLLGTVSASNPKRP